MIYFIKKRGVRNSNIKIGFTDDRMSKRMRELQNQSSDNLELIFAIPGDKPVEDMYHTMFAEYRRHGEWFENGPKLKKFIKANLSLTYDPRFMNDEMLTVKSVYDELQEKFDEKYKELLLANMTQARELFQKSIREKQQLIETFDVMNDVMGNLVSVIGLICNDGISGDFYVDEFGDVRSLDSHVLDEISSVETYNDSDLPDWLFTHVDEDESPLWLQSEDNHDNDTIDRVKEIVHEVIDNNKRSNWLKRLRYTNELTVCCKKGDDFYLSKFSILDTTYYTSTKQSYSEIGEAIRKVSKVFFDDECSLLFIISPRTVDGSGGDLYWIWDIEGGK